MFDELIMLAKGRCVWAGPMRTITAPQLIDGVDGDAESEVQGVGEWLERIGRGCPAGFNLADYLSEFSPCSTLSLLPRKLSFSLILIGWLCTRDNATFVLTYSRSRFNGKRCQRIR